MRTRFATLFLLVVALTARPAMAGQLTDSALADRVAEIVRQYVHFGIFDDINIQVDNRSVTLTGAVNNEVEKMLAFSLAHVPGVMSVTNVLKIDR